MSRGREVVEALHVTFPRLLPPLACGKSEQRSPLPALHGLPQTRWAFPSASSTTPPNPPRAAIGTSLYTTAERVPTTSFAPATVFAPLFSVFIPASSSACPPTLPARLRPRARDHRPVQRNQRRRLHSRGRKQTDPSTQPTIAFVTRGLSLLVTRWTR
nr:hypothetical protein CFP56_33780 [Quercus suber]